MKYKIEFDDRTASRVYELFGAGVQHGGSSILEEIVEHLDTASKAKAMSLCDEAPAGNISKEFDRGFVKGMIEVVRFFDSAKEHGRDITFRSNRKDNRKITV